MEVLKLLTHSKAVTACSLKMSLFKQLSDKSVKSCGLGQHETLTIHASSKTKANDGLLQDFGHFSIAASACADIR